MTVKDLSYAKTNSLNPLYLITNKINESIEEIKGNKYLILVTPDECKDTLKSKKNYGSKSEILTDQ